VTERRALRWIRVTGSAVLLLFLAFQVVNPRRPVVANTPGFSDPVAGFELASTPDHVFGILGRPGSFQRGETVVRMRLGIWLDFLFLLVYPAFYVAIAMLLVARGNVPRLFAGALLVLPLAMCLGDALENRELLALADTPDASAMWPHLARLRVFTLFKWYALYAASGIIAILVWRQREWWRWSAPLFGVAALLGVASFVHLPAIEWGIAPLGLAWLMTYVWALRA
jgi:hypothetical protein